MNLINGLSCEDCSLAEMKKRAEKCLDEHWPHAWPVLSELSRENYVRILCMFAQYEIERSLRAKE